METDLGQSAAAYSPVIIDTAVKGQQPFTPSFYEWLKARGDQIVRRASATNATTQIYSIPLGYVLFLTNIQMSLNTAGIAGGAIIYAVGIANEATPSNNALIHLGAQVNDSISEAQTFSIPLRLEEGMDVYVIASGGAGVTARAQIQGFLVKKDTIPQI